MELLQVESSMISAAGYDHASRTLEVVFRDGQTYRYYDVPVDVHQGLMEAESKGRYMRQRVIGSFSYERVGKGSRRSP